MTLAPVAQPPWRACQPRTRRMRLPRPRGLACDPAAAVYPRGSSICPGRPPATAPHSAPGRAADTVVPRAMRARTCRRCPSTCADARQQPAPHRATETQARGARIGDSHARQQRHHRRVRPSDQPLTLDLDIAALAGALGHRLYDAGVAVTPDQSQRYAMSLQLVKPTTLRQLYFTTRSIFVTDPDELPIFDRVFALVFDPTRQPPHRLRRRRRDVRRRPTRPEASPCESSSSPARSTA